MIVVEKKENLQRQPDLTERIAYARAIVAHYVACCEDYRQGKNRPADDDGQTTGKHSEEARS